LILFFIGKVITWFSSLLTRSLQTTRYLHQLSFITTTKALKEIIFIGFAKDEKVPSQFSFFVQMYHQLLLLL